MKRAPLLIAAILVAIAIGVGGYLYLNRAVNDPEFDDPALAAFTLVELEKLEAKDKVSAEEVARLLACFKDADENVRLQAELVLAKHPALALDPVRARLRHENARVRFGAAETLGFMGPAAAKAAADLAGRATDDDADVRYKAVFALGRLGVSDAPVFNSLIAALADKDERVRDTALDVLDKTESVPKEAVPALAKLLTKSAGQELRGKVLHVLARAGEPAVPTFRDLLKNIKPTSGDPALYGEYLVLIQATDKLGPPQLKSLLPELSALLAKANQASQGLEPDLVNIFKKCGPEGAKSMAEALQSTQKEPVVHNNRLTLLRAIGEIGPDAKVAVPMLIDVLKANTPKCFPVEYRPQILETLGDIGPSARDAIPAVEALLTEPALAAEARAALRRMGVIEKK